MKQNRNKNLKMKKILSILVIMSFLAGCSKNNQQEDIKQMSSTPVNFANYPGDFTVTTSGYYHNITVQGKLTIADTIQFDCINCDPKGGLELRPGANVYLRNYAAQPVFNSLFYLNGGATLSIEATGLQNDSLFIRNLYMRDNSSFYTYNIHKTKMDSLTLSGRYLNTNINPYGRPSYIYFKPTLVQPALDSLIVNKYIYTNAWGIIDWPGGIMKLYPTAPGPWCSYNCTVIH